jgi:serine protease AprX
VNSGAYSLPASALAGLAADPDVAYIAPDRELHGLLDLSTAAVNASAAANYDLDGTGIGIAILDSGVTLVNDLKVLGSGGSRIVYSQDFTGEGITNDLYGHGTHVAGIAAGNGKASSYAADFRTLRGVAPMARIINLRVLNSYGVGTDSAVIAAIQTAISLKSQYNIRVLNLSLGRPVFESYTQDPLCQAVEQAWKAGITVVVAAGNYGRDNSGGIGGYGTITAPGNDPYVITVGAMKTMGTPDRSDDLIASYSSKGPTLYDHVVKPDLVAPGNLVRSDLNSTTGTLYTLFPTTHVLMSYYANGYTAAVSSAYFTLSGTSMATPVVSGAAALLFQQNPNLTPDQVKARLMKSAYKVFPRYSTATDPLTGLSYNSQYDIFTVGAGCLDIQAALANTDLAPATAGSALSPAVALDSSGNVYLVNGTSVIWGGSVVWGNSVVWGTSVIWGANTVGQSVIWGNSVVWGNSTIQGYSVVWGTGTNGTMNPASVVWGSVANALDSMSVLTYGEN